MTSTGLRCCLLLVVVACYASCSRDVRRYTQPMVGKNPPPPPPKQPERDQGNYHGKVKRSIDEPVPDVKDLAENHFFKRSADGELEGALAFDDSQAFETSRSRRHADGYRIIRPTYRPPKRTRPKILYA